MVLLPVVGCDLTLNLLMIRVQIVVSQFGLPKLGKVQTLP